MNTIESKAAEIVKTNKAAKSVETPVETPSEAIPSLTEIRVLKNVILTGVLQKRINDAASQAGRAAIDAKNAGLGRVAKDMSGAGTLIPTVGVLSDMAKAGLLGPNQSKQDQAAVKAKMDTIKGLNLLIDGLALLGLARRD